MCERSLKPILEELGEYIPTILGGQCGQMEFSCNVATHLATKGLPFMVVYEVDVLQPTNLAFEEAHQH